MAHTAHCQATDLVHNRAVRISACPCGLISLHLGPVSLRISEAAFAGLADAIASANAHLLRRKSERATFAEHSGAEEFLAG